MRQFLFATIWCQWVHWSCIGAVDERSLETIKRCENRVELLFEWIQQLVDAAALICTRNSAADKGSLWERDTEKPLC